MKYRSFVAGLEAACKTADYLRPPVRTLLDKQRASELKVPEKALELRGAKDQKSLRDLYDNALAELKSREAGYDTLGKIIGDYDRKFPQKKVLSWFIHRALEENRRFLTNYANFLQWRYEQRSKSMNGRNRDDE